MAGAAEPVIAVVVHVSVKVSNSAWREDDPRLDGSTLPFVCLD
jgi:hypothetical protein